MRPVSAWWILACALAIKSEAACPPTGLFAPTNVSKTFIRKTVGEYGANRDSGGSHTGVDIVVNADYPDDGAYAVYAIDSGTVAYAQINGSETTGFGNVVVIDHDNNCYSFYAHLASKPFTPVKPGANLEVKVGDKVKGGQRIGYFVSNIFDIDSTGNARNVGLTAKHQTHFELISASSGRSGPGTLKDTILKAPATRVDPTTFLKSLQYGYYKAD
jgi:murein DD-endopeptidase MepM/ murein hydrolase activator NlpD